MADTREFYLVCNDGTIFGSDPTTIYKYLDMSDEGDLNDKAATVIYNFKNQFRVIDDYEIQITLTFNNRAERELFAMTNIDNIWAFGATGKIDKSVIYTKRAMVAGFEFLDNDYTNAIQSVLTLKVSGQWQSDLVKYTVPSPDDNGDGTKKYYAGDLYTTAKDSSVGANLLKNTSNALKTVPDSASQTAGGLIYTMSTDEISNTSSKVITIRVYINNTSSSPVEVLIWGDSSKFKVGSEVAANSEGYSTVTISSLNSSDTRREIAIRAYNANASISGVQYKLFKLEIGSTATPWLPNTSDANYSYLCEANYQYYKADENINQYKYGSTNYSNTIQLDIEDNQFIIYFVLNEGENKVTISNDTDSVTLTHTAFNNGELVPLGSEGIDYSLDSRDTVDAFSLWKDGTLLSDDWTVDNVEDYFTLLSILDTIKESEVSIIAQGPEGATLPYTIYTYSKHDFI